MALIEEQLFGLQGSMEGTERDIPQPGDVATVPELRSISLAGVTLARVAQDEELKVLVHSTHAAIHFPSFRV